MHSSSQLPNINPKFINSTSESNLQNNYYDETKISSLGQYLSSLENLGEKNLWNEDSFQPEKINKSKKIKKISEEGKEAIRRKKILKKIDNNNDRTYYPNYNAIYK